MVRTCSWCWDHDCCCADDQYDLPEDEDWPAVPTAVPGSIEVTHFGDLARGVRVFLLPDGTRREEPIEP